MIHKFLTAAIAVSFFAAGLFAAENNRASISDVKEAVTILLDRVGELETSVSRGADKIQTLSSDVKKANDAADAASNAAANAAALSEANAAKAPNLTCKRPNAAVRNAELKIAAFLQD
jgi:hypothetical protein